MIRRNARLVNFYFVICDDLMHMDGVDVNSRITGPYAHSWTPLHIACQNKVLHLLLLRLQLNYYDYAVVVVVFQRRACDSNLRSRCVFPSVDAQRFPLLRSEQK